MTNQAHVIEWRVARTMAHLWIDGRYTGISINIKGKHAIRPEVLEILNLPALPGKEG